MGILSVSFIFKSLFAAMALVFGKNFISDLRKHKFMHEKANLATSGVIGGIAYFFNTLGIGSYATSTAMLRATKQINDKHLPGTLNVTSILPELLGSFIFISIIKVDPLTIALMVSATCVGCWIGASIVSKLPEKTICFVISIALFFAASLMLAKQFNLIPSDYTGAIGFTGMKLIVAVMCSSFIGMLSSMGIGTYALFLALALTLGLDARAAFPIMMSATSLGNGFASVKFIKSGKYDRKATVAMAVVALVGVLVAAYVVKTLPLHILTWVVIGVIYYTGFSLFMKSIKMKNKKSDDELEDVVEPEAA